MRHKVDFDDFAVTFILGWSYVILSVRRWQNVGKMYVETQTQQKQQLQKSNATSGHLGLDVADIKLYTQNTTQGQL